MHLKVGELARRTGLTVRTLHHYDAIGLLSPSARSDAGYRLYAQEDVARLHAIQALRQIGLPLADIAGLLQGKRDPLPLIIQRQIEALERQVAQAGDLCARLKMLQSQLLAENEPDMTEWLSTLSTMSAYGKYFTTAEIKRIRESWKQTEQEWLPLIAAVRDAMTRGVPVDSLEIQPLARRWTEQTVRWMKGDFEMMERWQKMYLREPAARGQGGVDLQLFQYIDKAADHRISVLMKHFSAAELKRFNVHLQQEWDALAAEIGKAIREDLPVQGKRARELARKWSSLIDRTVGHDPGLRSKLLAAFAAEPLLRAGASLNPEMQAYIRKAWAHLPDKAA